MSKKNNMSIFSKTFWKQVGKEIKKPSKGRTACIVIAIVMIAVFVYWVYILSQLG